MRNRYTTAWLAWGGAFLAIEATAYVRRREDGTLSAHIWRYFKVRDKQSHPILRAALRLTLACFLAWLFLHLNFGILSF